MSRRAGPDLSTRVPLPREEVEVRSGADGHIALRRRKMGPVRSWILRLFRVDPFLTLHLDALGSEVWGLLDGHRSAREVLGVLVQRHPDEPDLAPRLGTYLSTLVRNRLIRLDRR